MAERLVIYYSRADENYVNGVIKNLSTGNTEIAEILTHAAFYAGWPKAWAAFRMAKDVWEDE